MKTCTTLTNMHYINKPQWRTFHYSTQWVNRYKIIPLTIHHNTYFCNQQLCVSVLYRSHCTSTTHMQARHRNTMPVTCHMLLCTSSCTNITHTRTIFLHFAFIRLSIFMNLRKTNVKHAALYFPPHITTLSCRHPTVFVHPPQNGTCSPTCKFLCHSIILSPSQIHSPLVLVPKRIPSKFLP
jgi:hypothetical protein